MEQKSILKSLLYVALFISLFVLIQAIFQLPAVGIYAYLKGLDFTSVFEGFKQGKYSDVIIISDLFSSLHNSSFYKERVVAYLSKLSSYKTLDGIILDSNACIWTHSSFRVYLRKVTNNDV